MAAWVIISGSPYAEGKCSFVAQCLSNALDSCASVRSFNAAAFNVKGCIGCDRCKDQGICIFDDDANIVLQALEEADAVVVVSPVYFAGVPSQFKALLDRFQPLFWKRQRLLKANVSLPLKKPLFVALIGEGGDPYGTDHALAQISSPFALANFAIQYHEAFLHVSKEALYDAIVPVVLRANEVIAS